MPRTKTTILGTDRLGEERAVKTTEDAEQDGEDEGLSCIDLTRRTAPPMAVEGAKQRAAERAAARAAARAVARQLGGGEDGRRGAKQPSQEQGSCGAPGCKYADFHLGPCSNLGADNGGERKRRRSSSGKGMAAKAAKAAKVKEVKAAKAATKATAKLLQEQEEAKAAALVHRVYWYGVYEGCELCEVVPTNALQTRGPWCAPSLLTSDTRTSREGCNPSAWEQNAAAHQRGQYRGTKSRYTCLKVVHCPSDSADHGALRHSCSVTCSAYCGTLIPTA